MARMIEIYDTTLRHGTQRKDISLSGSDKLNIARRLDALGVTYKLPVNRRGRIKYVYNS